MGGHHKVPMAELKIELQKLGCENVVTLLNSGNIIFEAPSENVPNLEMRISTHLEKYFGFSIPTIIRTSKNILDLLEALPFNKIELTKDTRFYVSLLRNNNEGDLKLPWKSLDNSYEIISKQDNTVCSVLDISITKTPKAMSAFEKFYGKDVTTRNWKTIERIGLKI